jgi:hypothetical protein
MQPCVTSGMNNDRKVHVVSSGICEYTRKCKANQMKDMPLRNLSCTHINLSDTLYFDTTP